MAVNGFSNIICSYIYGTFEFIKGILEAGQKMAKKMLDYIESLSLAALTLWNYTFGPYLDVVIRAVKGWQKSIVDMIWDPSSKTGAGHDKVCHKIFDCITFVNQLLDPNCTLFKQLSKWLGKQCNESILNVDGLNAIRSLLSDFQAFQQTVCNFGFTFELGIAWLKDMAEQIKKKMLINEEMVKDKMDEIKKLIFKYLNWSIDLGITDYLDKLASLFTCIIDNSETCASIASANNYYNSICNAMHLEKNGDTWDVDSEFKNGSYGWMDGKIIEMRNFRNELDRFTDTLVNPTEVSRASQAYNLSKNIFPGGIKWSDVSKNDGKDLSVSKLFTKKTWRKNSCVKYWDQTARSIGKAWGVNKKDSDEPKFSNTNATAKDLENYNLSQDDLEYLIENAEIDANGNIFVRDGCNLTQIYPDKKAEPIEEEYYADDTGSNMVVYKQETGELLSITQAALDINKNPDSAFAKRCEKIWRTLYDWSKNADTAKKYA